MEPLYGYMLLVKNKYYNKKKSNFDSWNFAPREKDSVSVENLIKIFQRYNKNSKIKIINKNLIKNKSETKILKLNAAKSKKILKWKIKYTLDETVENIVKWNKNIKTKSYLMFVCLQLEII